MNRGPRPDRATWATLGPLAASWLIVGGLIIVETVNGPLRLSDLFVTFGVWLLVTVPHLLFAAAVWLDHRAEQLALAGRDDEVFASAFLHAWIYVILAVALAVTVVIGLHGQLFGSLAAFTGLAWLLGWPLGFVAFRKARNRQKRCQDPFSETEKGS